MDQPAKQSGETRGARGPRTVAVGLGFDIAVGFGIFVFGGYWLDRRAGGGMRWTLAGAALGFLVAGYEVWKALRSIGAGSKSAPPGGRAREGGAPAEKPGETDRDRG